uniref:Uncharacterized protein LOC113792783 n=1 Tax=Dermatophagoides pteronyssinus TaxID=6956 RepID=A0A6P6Y2G4_DERPT|nr:uncharacterized protein LOC113792783 [Dermatophagoides pteronyssinus]
MMNSRNENNHKSIDSIRNISQKRLLHHSDSTISYPISDNNQCSPISIGSRDNQLSMQDNIKELLSRLNQSEDIETSTSRSIIHGLILVTIMITSLVAFVCSKVRRCSNFINLYDYEHCSKYFLFYSSMTIISCLATFIIYFLHLISQCDILCLSKKKYEFEIMFISIISCLLVLSSICYMTHTNIFAESFTLIKKRSQRRCAILKRRLNLDLQQHSINSNRFDNAKVVSYVRNNQRSKTLSTSLSDDFEDDVFIQ